MFLVNALFSFLTSALSFILPVFNVPDSFFTKCDGAFSFLIGIIHTANWIVPLDVLVLCISSIWLFDNFALLTRLGTFIIKLIRG